MNKFEKIALQCARDDSAKGWTFSSIKKSKSNYVAIFKEEKFSFEKAMDFKKWNKGIAW